MDDIQQLKEELAEAKKNYFIKAELAFQKQCRTIFELSPYLLGFSWKQGTPGFCDGDPCHFYLQSDEENIMLQLDDTTPEEVCDLLEDVFLYNLYHEENHRIEPYIASRYTGSGYNAKRVEYEATRGVSDKVVNPGAEGLVQAIEQVALLLDAIDHDLFENLFGDSVKVTVKRDGTIDVDEGYYFE